MGRGSSSTVTGSFDHLIIASTLPVFMPHGIHHLEALERGGLRRRLGIARRSLGRARCAALVDLEHWPAFQRSSELLVELLRDVGQRGRGRAARDDPAAGRRRPYGIRRRGRPRLRGGGEPRLPGRLLAVSQPADLTATEGSSRVRIARRGSRIFTPRSFEWRADVAVEWRFVRGPTFENSIGMLELDERAARLTISSAGENERGPSLERLHTLSL